MPDLEATCITPAHSGPNIVPLAQRSYVTLEVLGPGSVPLQRAHAGRVAHVIAWKGLKTLMKEEKGKVKALKLHERVRSNAFTYHHVFFFLCLLGERNDRIVEQLIMPWRHMEQTELLVLR